ncbi:transposase DNA-binding-containing protein [Bordetella genomosp. 9]|uniref:transposase DNA-binding-containing protein n=1 Tax=Bordetella genomosp. 9 TaxID=1416803 RepID=UPI003B27E80A
MKPVRLAAEKGASNEQSWIAAEIVGCEFRDARSRKRLGSVLERFGNCIGSTVLLACQNRSTTSRRDVDGRLQKHTVCGILMHSSLAVTADGLPLAMVCHWVCARSNSGAVRSSRAPTR